jgi:hypothetical protein
MAEELLVAISTAMVAVAVFVVGDLIRPRSWRHASDETSHTLVLDLAKTFFTAVVAFVFVTCWQQNQNAHSRTISESKGLVDTYLAAQALPGPDQQWIQAQLRAYTDQVITKEWPMMEQENRLSRSVDDTLDKMRYKVASIQTSDASVAEARGRAMESLDKVAQARHDRAMDVQRRIPRFLYVALILGAVLVLLNPVLSGMHVSRRSLAMTALLGVVLGSVLLAIHDLERPYAGSIKVPTNAFTYAQSQYEYITGGPASGQE